MNKKEKKILIIIILILIAIDQITKIAIKIANPTLIFGIMQIKQIPIQESQENLKNILIILIAIIIIIKYIKSNNQFIKQKARITLSIALAGAISIMMDRIIYGGVVNIIQINNNCNLNLAYIYIIITWIGMAIIFTRKYIKSYKRKKR